MKLVPRVLCWLLWVCAGASAQTLQLPWIWGDHMVVQRGRPMVVTGRAQPSSPVRLECAGQVVSVDAAQDGRFRAVLPAPPEGESFELLVRAGEDELRLVDLVAGELWLCAGQSNMAFALERAAGGAEALERLQGAPIRLCAREAAPWPTAGEWSEDELARVHPERLYEGAWTQLDASTGASFSAVALFFAEALAPHVDAPIGLVDVAVGGSTTEGWVARERLAASERLAPLAADFLATPLSQPWVRSRARSNLGARASLPPGERPRHVFEPGLLYEAAIQSLGPHAFAGVLWYQGESNADHPELQFELYELLLDSWRTSLEDRALPFFHVQLPAMGRASWPLFREAQAHCLRLPHTQMAVGIDLGHPSDVHPRDKQPLGERLALLARQAVYGESIDPVGVRLGRWSLEGEELAIEVYARHGALDKNGGTLEGFVLAGPDRRFHPAQARLEGGRVLLRSERVPTPVAARYAWAPVPACDLVDERGLPAAPWRSDDFPTLRVACIGDSITAGYGIAGPDQHSYPARLAQLLGPGWDVRNFGRSGTCVIDDTLRGEWRRAYAHNEEHLDALAFAPDVVVCNLGINDVMAWGDGSEQAFVADYLALIETYRELPSRPRLLLAAPLCPLFAPNAFAGDPRVGEIEAAIRRVAQVAGVATIDLRQPLLEHPELLPDGIHPDASGAGLLAEQVARALVGERAADD